MENLERGYIVHGEFRKRLHCTWRILQTQHCNGFCRDTHTCIHKLGIQSEKRSSSSSLFQIPKEHKSEQ